jgi:polyphosphate kinase 2 (PPK2 family)
MDDRDYEERLAKLQVRFRLLQRAYAREKHRAVVVLEGWDASGKGGLVRRIAWCLDPRFLRVHPIGPPDSHERQRHWLHRFWEKVPKTGEIAMFDRSWYGRVLVERVEGFASEGEWRRAYDEINQFEHGLCEESYRVVKLFLDITPETQLERFRARYETPDKRWKITEDDLRNRARWDDYAAAYDEMIERTSHKAAPWHRIDANSKKRARIEAFEILLEDLGKGIDVGEPDVSPLVEGFFNDH